jgi:hypothetical protein
MSDGERPTVELDWSFMWCAKHLKPFRQGWPGSGASLAMVNLFQACTHDPFIVLLSGGDVRRLVPIFREYAPMCCYLPAQITQAVVDAARAGRKWEPEL